MSASAANGQLDEAYERFARTGFEFGPGFTNHGPMAAEALVALERADAVLAWVDRYIGYLDDDVPRPVGRIDPEDWRSALGDFSRVADWVEFFRRALADQAWDDVVAEWGPRLLPGVGSALYHGLIRTGHAVRALEASVTPPRLGELASALAYGAARVRRGLIYLPVDQPDEEPAGGVLDGVDLADAGERLSVQTEEAVRAYLAQPNILTIHGLTGPSALRLALPYLSPEARRAGLEYLSQTNRALYARAGVSPTATRPAEFAVDFDALADVAAGTDDPHVIKFLEACFREHRVSGNDAFLAAAAGAAQFARSGGEF
jgi:hypothetical protein